MTAAAPTTADGALAFARFAHPPNALGYCGPADSAAVLEHLVAEVGGTDLRRLAAEFAGAWPYLQLLAGANGLDDPLDPRVVEAYWIGNDLLQAVRPGWFAASLDPRFRRQAGRRWEQIARAAATGGVPHHSFHVLAVYPWTGLLRGDGAREAALGVLDRCRIQCARVVTVDGDSAVVSTRRLAWHGRLTMGPPQADVVRVGVAGRPLVADLAPGDLVAVHWDWVCDRLDLTRARALQRWTARQLAVVDALDRPGPAELLA